MSAPELLAPAGSYESVCSACDYGADAVYVGVGPYNLRARNDNFSPEEFKDCIEYCTTRKVKLYAALNAMPDDAALISIRTLLETCRRIKAKPNAFIVSDPGVISLCKLYFKSVALHLSTQTGTFNSAAALFWKRAGIRRIVLPREMTLGRISALTKKTAMETEVFVHGAMCVSVSGRCLLGVYMGKRHPNWGDCPQPCRFRYKISAVESRSDAPEWFTVEEHGFDAFSKQGAYIFNSKDLNALPVLPGILAAGVSSLKIEGRNKSPHYVGTVVKVYREALDCCVKSPKKYAVRAAWTEELDRLDHRPYTTGFYGDEIELQEPGFSQSFSPYRIVGTVKALTAQGVAVVDVKNPFSAKDVLVVTPIRKGHEPFMMHDAVVSDIDGNPVARALTNRIVLLAGREGLRVGDMIRRDTRADGRLTPI